MSDVVSPVQVVLAFGANLGDRAATIRAALADIDALPGTRVERVSSLVETAALKPAGVDHDAPSYVNAVAMVTTGIRPLDLLDALHEIEHAHGRVRLEHWGDRTLDIDIIAYGELVLDDERLTLPHPRAAERAFVLAPWLEIAPDAVLPGAGQVSALRAAVDDAVRPFEEAQLPASSSATSGERS